MIFESQGGSLVLVEFELNLLQSPVNQFVQYTVEMDLLDVLLGLKQQTFGLLDLSLYIGHVLLESFQLLPVLLRNIQQFQKLLPMLYSHILNQILSFILKVNQVGLFLDQ